MITIRYVEAAEAELLLAIDFLESRSIGLGRRLFEDIQRAESHLARFPQAAFEIRPGIRRHLLRRFPYALIYSFQEDDLLILAVAHLKRHPNYWQER